MDCVVLGVNVHCINCCYCSVIDQSQSNQYIKITGTIEVYSLIFPKSVSQSWLLGLFDHGIWVLCMASLGSR